MGGWKGSAVRGSLHSADIKRVTNPRSGAEAPTLGTGMCGSH